MRVKPLIVLCVLVGASLLLLLNRASIQAQAATPPATAESQFELPQLYQDSLYTVNYPDGWITQTAPGAVALMSDRQTLRLIQQFGVPPLAHGQIVVQILYGLLGDVIANPPTQIINVNCTSCHMLKQLVAFAPVNGGDIVHSLDTSANAVALLYSGAPLHFPFGSAQAIKLGTLDAAEATFTSSNVDGLLIELYVKGQLVNLSALVAPGYLAEDQPLIEAIASTIQAEEAAPKAASTDSP